MNLTEKHILSPRNQIFDEGSSEATLSLISMAIRSIEPNANIFLFGSRAEQTASPRSDYDVAIDCGERIPLEVMSRMRGALEDLPIIQKVDIVDVYRTSEEFRKIAFSNWKRIV
ncbi:MAG: nucleotidyltransferase domain-containing protein [Ignavibacteriae bacterium]|nr:nucleotidyltransferase domain-containing protein [Ignavibacteriota bacterium]